MALPPGRGCLLVALPPGRGLPPGGAAQASPGPNSFSRTFLPRPLIFETMNSRFFPPALTCHTALPSVMFCSSIHPPRHQNMRGGPIFHHRRRPPHAAAPEIPSLCARQLVAACPPCILLPCPPCPHACPLAGPALTRQGRRPFSRRSSFPLPAAAAPGTHHPQHHESPT